MGKQLLSRKTVCLAEKWNYSNFVRHLKGAPASRRTAEKYKQVLGGDAWVWITGTVQDRQAVYQGYISKQLDSARAGA